MMGLLIHLFGEFQVNLDSQPINTFGYDKVRALLAYLAVESPSPHKRDYLAGLLWPDQLESAAHDSLRNALAKLRHTIHDQDAYPPFLLTSKQSIQLNPTSDHWLDVQRFISLLETCQIHRHRHIKACTSCTDRLIEAASLYHGDFLLGFSLPDSDLFEDWLRAKREEYLQQAIQCLQDLTYTYEWRAEPDKALAYAHRLIKLDPCREDSHVAIMRLYAIQGLRNDACQQYDKCREILSDELGVEPADEITRLYEQIKYGFYQPALSRQTQLNNLPTNLTSFVGREQELSEIDNLVADPACRLLSLVGPGGVGKTRLAIAAAARQLETFPNGACFVSLAGVNTNEGIVPSILQALYLQPSKEGDLKKQLMDFLRDKELLLVLDNYEHLLDSAGIVGELLQNSPGIMVLVTSRQRLGLQAEWIFEVGGLGYPAGKDSKDLRSYEAVQLFAHRLHQFKPRHTLVEDDLVGVSRICRVVEGMPLGIELAASAVRTKSIEQVATGIENGTEDLESSWKDVPERHRSLRAVFEHSYRMLNPEEQRAFCGLAVFRGGFTAEAAVEVAGATREILGTLVDQSMIHHDIHNLRYDLHELIKYFALEKLIASGKELEIRQRYIVFFVKMAEKSEELFLKKPSLEVISILIPEQDNFRSLLDWCINNNSIDVALQVAGPLGRFWYLKGLQPEGDAWMMKILQPGCMYANKYWYARALYQAGKLALERDLNASRKLLKQASQLFRKLHEYYYLANALYYLGWISSLQESDVRTITIFAECRKVYNDLDDQQGCANVDLQFGQIYLMSSSLQNLEKSRIMTERCLKIYREINDKAGISDALTVLGKVEMSLGNYRKARALIEESVVVGDSWDHIKDILVSIDALGIACFKMKDYQTAKSYYERGITLAKNIYERNFSTLGNLSYLASCVGNNDEALFFFKQVFSQLDNGADSHKVIIGGILSLLPGVLTGCNENRRAAKLYGYTDKLRRRQNSIVPTYFQPEMERDLAKTRHELGDETFNALWEVGRRMTLEEAKNCAMGAQVRVNLAEQM